MPSGAVPNFPLSTTSSSGRSPAPAPSKAGGTTSGLYDESDHRAACGLGFVAQVDGRPSREIVEQGLVVLANLNHRGAAGADAQTGDGAGVLVQVPHAFLRGAVSAECGFELPSAGWYGVGTCFIWSGDDEMTRCERLLSMIVGEEGQRVIGWRDVPTDPSAVGDLARKVSPRIRQVFIERRTDDREAFERKLYLIRRRFHRTVLRAFGPDRFYIVSLSSHTIVYKGLLQGTQVAAFYPDLRDPRFSSALALVHSRFSTNTAESWSLAHPYRYIAHNGEINTLRGNLNWMRTREAQLESDLFGPDIPKLHPIIEPNVSDSAAFDNALEFLHLGGRSIPQAIMTMVPEAWENNHLIDPNRRAFYHYSGALMQPWDGPAAIAFTNGRVIGGVLDRNGLRPARYSLTKDNRVVMASEDGVLPLDASEIVERWRLGPGRMILIDLEKGTLQHDSSAKQAVVSAHPYREWVYGNSVGLGDPAVKPLSSPVIETTDLVRTQRAFGYTNEVVRLLMTPMARNGLEAEGSMGTDTPLAILSKRPARLFEYFHQLFAQVTNPAIDPLRERLVMSLRVSLGREHNLLSDGPHHAKRIVLPTPILTSEELARVQNMTDPAFRSSTLSLLWPVIEGPGGLKQAVDRLCAAAVSAVSDEATILILSDRGVTEELAAIPSLLAVGAVTECLVKDGKGGDAAVVIQTGEAREVHDFAALIAFGAEAINPYLAFETITELATNGMLATEGVSPSKASRNYVKAINKGLLKIISKMGISTLHSYTGSQLFEIVGLHSSVADRFFPRAPSRLGGLSLEDIGRETLEQHELAFHAAGIADVQLDPGGEYQLRDQGPPHQWNERSIPSLQRAVRTNNYETYEQFSAETDAESATRFTLRSLLEFQYSNEPVVLEEVEPASEIVKRFNTGAMSLGSLGRETHEALAIAMNRIGGRSNSGEGGEEAERAIPADDGTSRRSAIKQVASARFGVTANYLINSDMLQIKVAQGAKPGEGGHLPGHKVSPEIAHLRNSTPGVGLISPPPHHDIYSIEDLAQLIFDLKMVAPRSQVSVKLVAEAGVGTVAAGVAKAKADHITIAGFDGGTGAAMQSSIKRAGLPWELGLAETQQVLTDNRLRGRVRLQVDGQIRTGRDVVVGALFGAEEFGFSTAPLVALGCVMMRVCHLNTCPVGIATQDSVLRARFEGQPEHVINYFFFVAEQVRRLMASLGFCTFDEMVGRVDKLHLREKLNSWKAERLDLGALLRPTNTSTPQRFMEHQVHRVDESFDRRIIGDLASALDSGQKVTLELAVRNTDRTIGGMISGEIARRYGAPGLPEDTIRLRLTGIAGQSFGAWAARGLTLDLTGAANDYVGKGLSGGILIVRAPENAAYRVRTSIIVGNVALYGATSGEAYFEGLAGERFAVRNSGATAVVEGCGDHGCEYMTGGVVVVLGRTGRNFAAGMSGGLAFVYDPYGEFPIQCNSDMVAVEKLGSADESLLRELIVRHVHNTDSAKGKQILEQWDTAITEFAKVLPHDLRRVLEERRDTEVFEQQEAV